MSTDQTTSPAKSRFTGVLRTMALGCGVIGFLIAVSWPVAELVFGVPTLDDIPNWLGITLLFFIVLYGVWEIRLALSASAGAAGMGHTNHPDSQNTAGAEGDKLSD